MIKYKKFILASAIVIVLNLFINYAVQTISPAPRYDKFCTEDFNNYPKPFTYPQTEVKTPEAQAEYDKLYREQNIKQMECNKAYMDSTNAYNRNVFIVLVVAGLASITVGFFVASSGAVSLGFSFGGLLSLVIGTIRFWSDMQDYMRLGVLGVALVALIWVGVKKFRD